MTKSRRMDGVQPSLAGRRFYSNVAVPALETPGYFRASLRDLIAPEVSHPFPQAPDVRPTLTEKIPS